MFWEILKANNLHPTGKLEFRGNVAFTEREMAKICSFPAPASRMAQFRLDGLKALALGTTPARDNGCHPSIIVPNCTLRRRICLE
ncbi:MAG: hypothetical protein ACLSH7_07390 [Veillonella parvula]